MIEHLLALAHEAVAAARKCGADAAEALVVDGRGIEVQIREGAIEKLEQAESRELGLRAFAGKSSAIISGSVLTSDAIRRLAENAVAAAKLAPPDPFAGLADSSDLARALPELDLVSLTLPDVAELKRLALAAEREALAVAGVSKSNGAGASSSDSAMALVTSNGFAMGYRKTGVGLSASAIAGEATAMERDYDFSSAVHFGDLRSPEAVGREAGERAVRRLNPRKIASQAVPVIFDRRVASSLLGHLAGAINGAAVTRGTSFLKDRLGTRIFPEGVNIIDDPLRVRGLASKPFDGEGLPVVRRAVIDAGNLTSWTLDLRSARQLGLQPTGQAARGLGSPPGPSTSNLYLQPGGLSPEALRSETGRGLYVTELIGMGVNIVTGDYSRGASGFWIENGELAYPVSEITIAGNLRDMFLTIVAANDLEFRGATNAPTVRIEGLTVAGR